MDALRARLCLSAIMSGVYAGSVRMDPLICTQFFRMNIAVTLVISLEVLLRAFEALGNLRLELNHPVSLA